MKQNIKKYPAKLTLYRVESPFTGDNVIKKGEGLTGKEIDENMIFLHQENLELQDKNNELENRINELEKRVRNLEEQVDYLEKHIITKLESSHSNQIKVDIIKDPDAKIGNIGKISFADETYFIAGE